MSIPIDVKRAIEEVYGKEDEFVWHPNFGNIFTKLGNPYAAVEYEYVLKQEIDQKISELPAGTEVNVASIEAIGTTLEVSLEVKLPEPTEVISICMDNIRESIARDVEEDLAQCVTPIILHKGCSVGKSTEVGANVINRLRDAVFAIEEEIGVPSTDRFVCATMENPKVEFITRGVEADDIITNLEDGLSIRAGTGPTCSTGGNLTLRSGAGVDVDLYGGIDAAIGRSVSTVTIVSPDGVTCKKCNDFNQYCTSPSESDGTHLCYKCRKGY